MANAFDAYLRHLTGWLYSYRKHCIKENTKVKKIYRMKKTVSMKQFITELGADFSKHVKQRLLELGGRCVLTRKDESFILDLRHVEHTKYDCRSQDGTTSLQKEYAFGQLIVHEGTLYFSRNCLENEDIMQAPMVGIIYDSLDGEELNLEGDIKGKKIDDENIDYIIDNIMTVCPEISPEHLAIISRY
jgi:hypothetical protein